MELALAGEWSDLFDPQGISECGRMRVMFFSFGGKCLTAYHTLCEVLSLLYFLCSIFGVQIFFFVFTRTATKHSVDPNVSLYVHYLGWLK